MIRIFRIFLILTLPLTLTAQKQRNSQDSIKVFYDSLFSKLKAEYLFKDTVNWMTTESDIKQNLTKYNDFKTSLNEIEPLFRRIGATHCAISYKENKYSIPATILPDSYSEQWKKKYMTNPTFETKVVDGKYGYILIPAINFADTRQKNVNKISQGFYDQIADLKTKYELKGWIIDLRFNTGGNSWPMLLALYDLLGNNDVSGTLNIDKKLVKMASLSKGIYLVDSVKQFWIKPKGKLQDKSKVAIITGVVTASSGEVVAMAFKGRPNSIFIGDNSLGMTSANYGTYLPFTVLMSITKDYNGDRNGNYYERIIPDIVVLKQDNFDDLLLDKNIQEAIKFINGE